MNRFRALLKGGLKGLLVCFALTTLLIGLRWSSVEEWQRWFTEHAVLFLVWRLALYAVIVWGWIRVRRLRQYESSPEARRRWRRTEIAVLTTFILLEVSHLWGA